MADGKLLWEPPAERLRDCAMARLMADRGAADYEALWRWSVEDLDGFWGLIWERYGELGEHGPVLADASMPGAVWFPGTELNYAERLFRGKPGDRVAVVHASELRELDEWTWGRLRGETAAIRAGLAARGVGRGDRVAAYLPNIPETLAAFLATASLGAVWSSAAPEFGARSVVDRFGQIEPKVLLAIDGYRYGGKDFDRREAGAAIGEEIGAPVVRLGYLDGSGWEEGFLGDDALAFEPVPFDHPLWVLYSSGTTGLPKAIVQGQGGILLEQLKMGHLHLDCRDGDRVFWFTTTGWMMWNFLIGGLLVGAPIVLFDGNPGHPDLGALWRLAEKHRITVFGTSAPFLQACLKAGLRPGDENDLSGVRSIGSTGAPLSEDGFRWIGDAVGAQIQIGSMSGGTDVCTGFVGSAPNVPVWMGEISCASLGVRVVAYDEEGKELVDEVGELVITNPMPSMPVMFWNDPDGTRLREAYFEDFPGVWRHGDWVRVTPRGSYVIYGRSDSTLNRGGVRMGTADFYAVVEGFAEVADSLVIDTTELGGRDEGALLCFLVLADGASLSDVEPGLRKALRSELSPRHVPDRFVVVEAIPRTLNGKKCEVPVKKILAGVAAEKAVSRGALLNPDALAPFLDLAARGV